MKHLYFEDDQPITTMPERCTLWPCRGTIALWVDGFWRCVRCKASYGKGDA